MSLQNTSDFKVLPRHIAIIMDGNGRWAKAQGKERIFGHQKGVESVRRIVELSVKAGIQYLSLFAFSLENWNRPKNEVDGLMELLVMAIEKELPELHKNNIILKTAGNTQLLPQRCRDSIQNSIKQTSLNSGMTLCIAISYSGKWDILQAATKMANMLKNEEIKQEDISEELFSSLLSTASMPDPELLIRTSGEFRISNFFLWQNAYTELYFSPKFWPEFDKDDFYDALSFFQNRERRFGKISEQL